MLVNGLDIFSLVLNNSGSWLSLVYWHCLHTRWSRVSASVRPSVCSSKLTGDGSVDLMDSSVACGGGECGLSVCVVAEDRACCSSLTLVVCRCVCISVCTEASLVTAVRRRCLWRQCLQDTSALLSARWYKSAPSRLLSNCVCVCVLYYLFVLISLTVVMCAVQG